VIRAASTAAVVLATAAALTAHLTAGAGALTRPDVEAAIALGERVVPEPYRLRHAGRPDNPTVVGAVYTPFVRVAFLARAAFERGRHLQADDIASEWTSPLVYIAFRWYCCDNGVPPEAASAIAAAEPRVVMLPLARRAPESVPFRVDGARHVNPVWSRPGTALLDAFGAPPPWDDIALVAAFPVDVLEQGRPFVVYKDTGRGQSIRIGVVRAADAASWR
jgi:hypothetical protein